MKSMARQRRSLRARRHARVLKKIRGTAERPRLVVFRSLRHMEGQLVDDDRRATLLGVSTGAAGVRESAASLEDVSGKTASSFAAGKLLAERALAAGVNEVIFDRGGYRYHGRVKAFADGARVGGLRF